MGNLCAKKPNPVAIEKPQGNVNGGQKKMSG